MLCASSYEGGGGDVGGEWGGNGVRLEPRLPVHAPPRDIPGRVVGFPDAGASTGETIGGGKGPQPRCRQFVGLASSKKCWALVSRHFSFKQAPVLSQRICQRKARRTQLIYMLNTQRNARAAQGEPTRRSQVGLPRRGSSEPARMSYKIVSCYTKSEVPFTLYNNNTFKSKSKPIQTTN